LQSYQQKTKKQSAGDLQATLDQWLTRRGAAQRALVEWLDSPDYATFVADFLHFCRTPGAGIVDLQPEAGAAVVPSQVRHVVPTLLLSDVPVETLHRLRIACKYLRYNLEFMAGLLGPECAAIIALLRRLQDDLGDLNDAVVSSHLLTTDANAAPPVARYARSQEELIDKLRRQMRGDFARFVAAGNRERLLTALAKL
jgi:CHAD domain-containing protein